MKLKEKFR